MDINILITEDSRNEIYIKNEIVSDDLTNLKAAFEQVGKQTSFLEPNTKCGEVFFGYRGIFTIVCAICSKSFETLDQFGEHIQDSHIKLKELFEYAVIEDSFIESREDPLHNSSASERGVIKQEQGESATNIRESSSSTSICATQNHSDNNDVMMVENEDNPLQELDPSCAGFACKLCNCTYMHHRSYLAHARRVHGILTTRMRNKQKRKTRQTPSEADVSAELNVKTEKTIRLESDDSLNEDKKGRFPCVLCKRVYSHRRSLRGHVRRGHGKDALNLLPNMSPAKCRTKLEGEYSATEEEYRCVICGRIYRHRRSLRSHIRADHSEKAITPPPNAAVCKYCDKDLGDKKTLEVHINDDHPGDKKYICPHCPKVFRCKTTRQDHINTHTGERPFKCPHCSWAFSNSSNLAVHIKMHLQIKKHPCSFCGKPFVSSSEKRRHERTHTGEKLHQCEECGKRYPSLHKLKDHLRRHQNIKNFKCEVCAKPFYTPTMLKDHMSAHSKERPFNCNVCGQSFPRRRALKVHEQLHSEVKKYVCTTCGKAFAQCAGLYSHRKSHGGIK